MNANVEILLMPLLLKCQIWIYWKGLNSEISNICSERAHRAGCDPSVKHCDFSWYASSDSQLGQTLSNTGCIFSSQMMRHKSLVPRSGLSPLIQPQMIMLLLHIGCFDKCLITVVALWDVETQIVGCQLARGETPRWSHKTQLIAQISGPHSQSHSRLQQIRQIQNHSGRNTFVPEK